MADFKVSYKGDLSTEITHLDSETHQKMLVKYKLEV